MFCSVIVGSRTIKMIRADVALQAPLWPDFFSFKESNYLFYAVRLARLEY